MYARIVSALALLILLSACQARQERAAGAQPVTPVIVYVTPTPIPTLVPTAVRFPPTDTPDSAPDEQSNLTAATCEEALVAHYAAASDHCLAGPTGFFCNGGFPPVIEPSSDALTAPGALGEADKIERLQSPPLSAGKGGGLLWLRLEKDILMDALIIGNVSISNRVSAETGLAQMAFHHHRKRSGGRQTAVPCHLLARWLCKAYMVKAPASLLMASPPTSTARSSC